MKNKDEAHIEAPENGPDDEKTPDERLGGLSAKRRELYEKLQAEAESAAASLKAKAEEFLGDDEPEQPGEDRSPDAAADEAEPSAQSDGPDPGEPEPPTNPFAQAWETWRSWASGMAGGGPEGFGGGPAGFGGGPAGGGFPPVTPPGAGAANAPNPWASFSPVEPPGGDRPVNPWANGLSQAGAWRGWPGGFDPSAGQAPPWAQDGEPEVPGDPAQDPEQPAKEGPAGGEPGAGPAGDEPPGHAGPDPAAGGPGASEPVIALKKSGSYPPLFLVAPIFGSAFPYHQLALHLDREQPLYGLQSPALHGAEAPETVPEMAASYVRTIRRLQPVGPYYLGGYSFGGWAAFEIARQLRAAGQKIAFLGMLGTSAPPSVAAPLMAQGLEFMSDLWASHAKTQRDTGLDERQRMAFSQAAGTLLQQSAAANTLAAARYVPRPFEGGMTLFLTADTSSPTDRTLGWWTLCTREI
ncbi:MAG: thioesterase domain-containing protein [Acidobacteriota bacterium]